MNQLAPSSTSALDRLREERPDHWPNIAAAQDLSATKMAQLLDIAGDLPQTDEGALVVFGSLARGEFTEGSDLDWTIIIDGRADSSHLELVHTLKRRLKGADFNDPGPTGLFGGLVFSHELIHAIGGEEDTNRNMTRRLLLLLESKPIDAHGSTQAFERVMNGILNRYVQEDASWTPPKTYAVGSRRDSIGLADLGAERCGVRLVSSISTSV